MATVRIAVLTAGYGGVWVVLTGAESTSWVIGVAAVAAAVAMHARRAPARISVRGALHFAGVFLMRSLAGGWDVARRVWQPRLPIEPGYLVYRGQLAPDDPAWPLFVGCVSLMPGTLAADVRGAELLVHALDRELPVAHDLAVLEQAARGVFVSRAAAR